MCRPILFKMSLLPFQLLKGAIKARISHSISFWMTTPRYWRNCSSYFKAITTTSLDDRRGGCK
ncbi:hypothetical protein OSTOST_10251 [Ostertagia ostertagi]